LVTALLLLLLATDVPDNVPDIVTDRPDITESAIVVPKASLQFENGVTFSLDHGERSLDLSETLVRLGLSKRFELRLGLPNHIDGFAASEQVTGFGDPSVGMKYQIGPLPGRFDLSVIAGVTIPSATAFSSGGADPFVKFPWSRELGRGWSVGGMQSLFFNSTEAHRPVWEPVFYLERELTHRWEAFAEYAGDYHSSGAPSQQVMHFGTAYKLKPLQQIDFHFGFGLNDTTPQRFFAAGYSFRFDHLGRWWKH